MIWKDIAGRRLEPDDARTLLSGGATAPMEFRSREGKEFTAGVKLEQNRQDGKWQTRFVFSNSGDSSDDRSDHGPLGVCPQCGGEVVEGKKGYGCKNWREQDGGCRFVIWKNVAGRELSPDIARDLLEKGVTEVIGGFISRKGTEFSARLKLDGETYKTTFVFD